ncbi:MAG: alpha/beta hydrolase [Bryobacteraceae bacterium]|nr:alpha/beta hydrolase [Bryobacteraceae bacterium]MDW8379058.1 alpha/beta hydrolase [Bryobacterales bacterium]
MKQLASLLLAATALGADLMDRVEHGYADNKGVKLHYVTLGKGPLVVLIHGFPDFWYSWRHQMEALAENFQVVAMDLRGYNLSDKPKGVENYDMNLLVSDVLAVIRHLGKEKATIVGHDWGGAIAWSVAAFAPSAVDKLVIVNLPHPHGLRRELAHNPEQQKNSQYARNFQQEEAHRKLSAEGLAAMVPAAEREKYIDAFRKSDFEAMLNYYKRNYPREPYRAEGSVLPNIQVPVLMFHGLKDWALLPGALNDTWKWIEAPLTLVTIPHAGHWSHWDAADLVTKTMKWWLSQ